MGGGKHGRCGESSMYAGQLERDICIKRYEYECSFGEDYQLDNRSLSITVVVIKNSDYISFYRPFKALWDLFL